MDNQDKNQEELLSELFTLKQENDLLKAKIGQIQIDQSRFENAYIDSESKYRKLFESANDAIFLMDSFVFTDCNPKTLEMFGCSMDQIIGLPPHKFSPLYQSDGRTSEEASKDYITKVYNGEPQLFEWTHTKYDGTPFDVEISLNLFQSSDQKLIQAMVRNITERKLFEKKIQESNEELTITLKSIGDAVIVADYEGLITYLNPVAESLTGWNLTNAIGQPLNQVFNIINAVTKKPAENPFFKVIDSGKIVGLANHTILLSKDGREYQIADSAAPLLDSEDKIRGAVLVFRDVTEEYQRDFMLKNSEQLYRTVFESTGTAAIIIEQDTIISLANDEWVRLSGYSKEDLEGKMSWTKFVVAEDLEKMKMYHYNRRNEKGDAPIKYEFRFVRKNGEIRNMINCVNMIPGTTKSIASLMDITDLKQAQIALIESEENNRLLLELAPDAFLQGDKLGYFIQGNRKASVLTGFTKEELLTMHINDLFAPSLLNEKPLRFDLLNSGETVIQEREIIRKDKGKRVVEMNSRRMPNGTYQTFIRDITERKQIENSIKKSNELLSQFLKYSPIYSFIKEVSPSESRVIMASENYVDMIGIPGSKMIGKTMFDLFPPDLAEQFTKDDWHVVSNNKLLEVDEELNGRFYKTIKFPIVYGDTNMLAGYTIDMTDRIENEEQLKRNKEEISKQNELLNSLLKNLTQGVFMVEVPSGKPLLANESAMNLLGRGIMPDANKNNLAEVYKAFKAENRDPYPVEEMPIHRGMIGESSYVDDMIVVRPDGTEKLLEVFGVPILNSVGEVWASLVSFSDITERKLAELALSESESRFKTVFMQSPIGISLSDSLNGRIIQANPRYAEIVGRSIEEMPSVNWMEITHPDDVGLDQEKNMLLLKGAIPEYQMEKRYIQPSGNVVWVNMTIVPLSEKLYNHPHNLCMIEDITDKKRYELELIKAKEKAEESDRLKSAFLANMSHEIRTPMNGIIGFSSLLKEPNLSGQQQQEYIKLIEKSGYRMLTIINDIIDISKIEAGLMLLNIREVNITELIDNLYNFFNPEIQKKGLQFIVTNKLAISESKITSDREKLNSILTNLIKNAIKFTNQGMIEVGCEHKNDYVEFYVKDSGIGIVKERQKAIFERFIQADITDSRAFQGAGLGLAISKAYVEMLGGKIWVESSPDLNINGSVFYFTLPFVVSSETTEFKQHNVVKEEVNPSLQLKVLIAEDDDTSQMLISKSVRSISKEILKAKTGIEAVEICRTNPDVDLILMDIQMPEMDGYTATRKIREFNANVKIIAQTAYALTGDKEKAINAGCDNYITKPISKDHLLKMIYEYFNDADGNGKNFFKIK